MILGTFCGIFEGDDDAIDAEDESLKNTVEMRDFGIFSTLKEGKRGLNRFI